MLTSLYAKPLFLAVTRRQHYFFNICFHIQFEGDRDSSIGIATRYGLGCPGIESRWGGDFPHPSRPALGVHPPSCTMGNRSFPEVKWPGRGVDHPPLSSAEIEGRVELYSYSQPGPSWPVIGWPLPLPLGLKGFVSNNLKSLACNEWSNDPAGLLVAARLPSFLFNVIRSHKVRELFYGLRNGVSDCVFMKENDVLLTVQQDINNQQMYFNIYDVFCSQYCHKNVSAGNPAIFRVMFLLREYSCG